MEDKKQMTVKEFAEKIYGNIGGVRSLIFYSDITGFDKCIKRVRRKIFIDVAEYYKWQSEQTNRHNVKNKQRREETREKRRLQMENNYADRILHGIPSKYLG